MTHWIFWWRGLMLILAFTLAWFSLVKGISGYYAGRVAAGEDGLIDTLLGWHPNHPSALFAKAITLDADDPEASTALLERAYRANPSNPFPLIALADRLLEDGQLDRADAMIELASRLAPVDPRVQQAAGRYWGQRGRLDRTLVHWSTMLEADRTKQALVFPALLKILETPESRLLLEPLAVSPPPWWTDFFSYAARNAIDADPVRFLYALRRQSTQAPITADERVAYVARLQKHGAVMEAYLVWLSGLDDKARQSLGLLFDGGFELPIDDRGFGWRVSRNDHFSGEPLATRGANGRALRLRFRAYEGSFSRVAQPLVLDPGIYRLSGRVRIDSLASKGGLQWTLRCVLPESGLLADGQRFLGSADWADFEVYFEVPDGCVSQQLMLVSAGTRPFERTFNGAIWFDDMKIVRAAALDVSARADALVRDRSSTEGSLEKPISSGDAAR